jgi:hypothetical protein
LLQEVISRLLQNKKILAQANERARKKVLCLASKIEIVDNAEVQVEKFDYPAALIGIELSPTVWSTIRILDNAVLTHSTA